ncbi:hypothetical protein QJQ45_024277 [Haematococcus lacustris]|nr:hypothetical protein QJQ45_024277 [Haematococcus lacustris]
MAPKGSDAPPPLPVDLAGVQSALQAGIQDAERLSGVIAVMLALDSQILRKEPQLALKSTQSVIQQLSHSSPTVRGVAVRAIARLASLDMPELQAALNTQAVAQAAWSICTDFCSNFSAYKPAYAALLAAQEAEAATKLSGAKPPPPSKIDKSAPPPDPEASLPGPSKHSLDAALRVLSSLLLLAPHSTCAWLLAPDSGPPVAPLLLLLLHHSLRVQHRAVRALGLLGSQASARPRLAAAGAALALMRVASSSRSGAVRVEAVEALAKLADVPGALHTQLVAGGAVEQLLQLVVDPRTLCEEGSRSGSPGGPLRQAQLVQQTSAVSLAAAGAAAGGQQLVDYQRPAVAQPADLQLAALRLLIILGAASQAALQQVAAQGGLQLLCVMLPDAAQALALLQAQSAALSQTATPTTPAAATTTPPPSAAMITSCRRPSQVFAALHRGGAAEEGLDSGESEEQQAQPQPETEWVLAVTQPPPLTPSAKLPNTACQASGLTLISLLLSLPGVQQAVWEHAAALVSSSKQQQAVADAPPYPLTAPGGAQTPGSTPGQPGLGEDGFAAPELPLHELLLHFFSAALPAPQPPPPSPEPAPAGGKGGKKDDKKAPPPPTKVKAVEPPPPLTLPPHLVPPFPPAVRAAALACVTQLAKHTSYAALLARHPGVQQLVRQLGQPPPARDTAPIQPASGEAPHVTAAVLEPELAVSLAALVQLLSLDAGSGMQGSDLCPARLPLKDAAACAAKLAVAAPGCAGVAVAAAAGAILTLPQSAFMVPARPPLPSPPPTPPPQPVATSMYVWDALDRPAMTDGKVRLAYL